MELDRRVRLLLVVIGLLIAGGVVAEFMLPQIGLDSPTESAGPEAPLDVTATDAPEQEHSPTPESTPAENPTTAPGTSKTNTPTEITPTPTGNSEEKEDARNRGSGGNGSDGSVVGESTPTGETPAMSGDSDANPGAN